MDMELFQDISKLTKKQNHISFTVANYSFSSGLAHFPQQEHVR